MEKKLPENWTLISFTSIFDINGGTQPPKSEFIYEDKEGYIRLLQIRDFGLKPVPTYIPNTGKLRTCKKSDVLIARYGASIGRILTGMEGAYNVAIAKVKIPKGIEKRYVFWLLNSPVFQDLITSFQRTAQNGFNKNDLANIFIPLPPLPEQKRIVAKLDELFGHLELIQAGLARIPALLADLRQSILTQAVTGKLTEEWREGEDVWEKVKMNDLVRSIKAGKNFRCPEIPVTEGKVGLVKISAVTWGFFDERETKTVEDADLINSSLFIKKGDFLISRANTLELVGASVVVNEIHYNIMLSDKIWRVEFYDEITKIYINHFLKSRIGRDEIESRASGNQMSMRNLSQKKFLDINITLPSILEQQEIVRRVKSLFAKADTIEARYEVLKAKIEDLPQAILAKAFRGELVAQLPEDGDARELLREIKALREEMADKKKKKRK